MEEQQESRKGISALALLVFFLLGIILGFLIAPIKNGISIRSRGGNKLFSWYTDTKD